MKTKKLLGILLCILIVLTGLVGCGLGNSEAGFDTNNEIVVVSREEGAGTRGAFVELTGVQEKYTNGNEIDNTTEEAIISNSTSIVMTTVAQNSYAIGYTSLGTLNDTVKVVKVDSVEATAENIINGTYGLVRPFNIVTGYSVDELTQDFINFILSEEGQKIVSDNGYIEIENSGRFAGGDVSGSLVITGSSSVTPVMEKLKEAYEEVNKNVDIEVQESDSTTGIISVAEGTCQIGMASRELGNDELSKGLTSTVIAIDGIVVIVNENNTIDDLSLAQIKNIFCGYAATWNEIYPR